ncbi:MAG TPA: FAD-binding protein [Acidimicrobiia bacterium]|jgi:glycolate oxidase FAD binding subunit
MDLMAPATVAPELARAAAPVVEALRAEELRHRDTAIVMVGAGTHADVGNPVRAAAVRELRIPAGVVTYDPDDMTVTVLAGTTVAELTAVVGEAGQEVALDPRDERATVGGAIAAGLSGIRRLRHGPVRDTLLEVRVVDGSGTLVKGGGPVVKNVTGYDLPRLFVGSLGTLGAIVQVTLRCRPRAGRAAWFQVDTDEPDAAEAMRLALYRPSAVLFDGHTMHVLLEGHAADLTEQANESQLGTEIERGPALPDGAHRGRISVATGEVAALGRSLATRVPAARWCAELGVGTVHVACDHEADLVLARDAAVAHGGWLLREAGAPGIDGFGVAIPNAALAARVKAAFDPQNRFAPGRLPL